MRFGAVSEEAARWGRRGREGGSGRVQREVKKTGEASFVFRSGVSGIAHSMLERPLRVFSQHKYNESELSKQRSDRR